MSHRFYPAPAHQLMQMMQAELDQNQSVFGIPSALFVSPAKTPLLRRRVFGKTIHSPVGVAAGPHTQLAQNIVMAWLTGARYLELKTVQTLDEIDVSRPCIDMEDEGYNCEWSQELPLASSFEEYLKAWVLIHVLNHQLGWGKDPGMIFHMSVGYNLKGIQADNMTWFFQKMKGAKKEVEELKQELRPLVPAMDQIHIPYTLSDNVCLSTMHGCPAREIEAIATHLMEKWKLHTFIKLNPTLLGPETLRTILNASCGFKAEVPDEAFQHDVKYEAACRIITNLENRAGELGLEFGLKLTNTLETINNKEIFDQSVKTMYMSGRALHPLSVQLALQLQQSFDGRLNISFSGGADAFNAGHLLASGFQTVTVCTDLLKPGGYMRLAQYPEAILQLMKTNGAMDLETLPQKESGIADPGKALLANLEKYAESLKNNPAYTWDGFTRPNIKSQTKLEYFDCISAPCQNACAAAQDVPRYLFHTAQGNFDLALKTILQTNPFPNVTGMVCDHLCQNKCTRIHYDQSLMIREVKRFNAERASAGLTPAALSGYSVAIVGAGPSGLSCACYLALSGFEVDVYEARKQAGGMVEFAIPGFRLSTESFQKDMERFETLGIRIHYNQSVNQAMFLELKSTHDFVYVSPGARHSAKLNIPGLETKGVLDSLDFLFNVKAGKPSGVGKKVVVIGGGNTAMDAARTAWRLVGEDGWVKIVYRRRIEDMPADKGEIKAVLQEGIEILECCAPETVLANNGQVKGLRCYQNRMEGGLPDERPRPVAIADSRFELTCDTIIPAIGQAADLNFVGTSLAWENQDTLETNMDGVFAGGDAMRGGATAIKAIADGRKAAEAIIVKATTKTEPPEPCYTDNTHHKATDQMDVADLMLLRAKRQFALIPEDHSDVGKKGFQALRQTLHPEDVMAESHRCLHCDQLCNICTTVCPNFANRSYVGVPATFALHKAVLDENQQLTIQADTPFAITQKTQIIHLPGFCNECGNCRTFCPTAGSPYKDKPHLHLQMDSFREAEEGYILVELADRTNLIYKHKNNIKTLSDTGSTLVYETDFVMAEFNKADFRLKEAQFLTPCVKEARFQEAAIMYTIMQGAKQLLCHI